MIPAPRLKAGLLALAEITHTTIDPLTERLWQRATRELTEAQWVHGVDVTIRTWRSTWMPPPAVVIEAAYTAPPPPAKQHPIRENGALWSSEAQERYTEQIVRENPRADGESAVDYAGRIATLAGLNSAAATEENWARENCTPFTPTADPDEESDSRE
jgi:hypothetical protein